LDNDRLRVPPDSEYFHAIGLATVAFARLEWDAVWCCNRLEPSYINSIEPRRKTAGIIANDLVKLFSQVSDVRFASRISPFAAEFVEVVKERNGLMHGKPATAPNGDQRLFRHGAEWTVDAVNAFSDRCVRAGMPLNALLYDELNEPCQVTLSRT
jgi:hypothetical protein